MGLNLKVTSDTTKNLFLILFAGIIITHHFAGYFGHYGYDDLHYAELSKNLCDGKLDWSDHYSYRWTILGVTTLTYSFFGINDFASALPAMIMTLMTLVLVFVVLKKYSPATIFLGLSLFALSQPTLFWSDKLMPDVYVAFFTFLSLISYWLLYSSKSIVIPVIGTMLGIIGAFLSKFTLWLFVPVFVYFFLNDLLNKRFTEYWIRVLIGSLLFLIVYFGLNYFYTGNIFARFNAIAENSYRNFCSYGDQPVIEVIKRVSYKWIQDLSHSGMVLGLILALPVFIFRKKHKSKDSTFKLFSVTTIILLLSANFLSISYNSYNPMCIDSRHYLYLSPILAIVGAISFDHFKLNRKYLSISILFLCGFSLLIIPMKSQTLYELYLPFGLVLILAYIFQFLKMKPVIIFYLLGFAMLLKPLNFLKYSLNIDYGKRKKIVTSTVLSRENDTIITDEVQKRLLRYYSGFEGTNKIYSYNDSIGDISSAVLVKNWHTQYLSGLSDEQLPLFAQKPHSFGQPITEDSLIHLGIFEIENFSGPELIYTSKNGFENDVVFWGVSENDLDTNKVFAGNKSNQVKEFSATLRLPVDSMCFQEFETLSIEVNFQGLVLHETNSALIISISNEKKETIFWKPYQIFQQIKSFDTWYPVHFQANIESGLFEEGYETGIYVWNKDRDDLWIDEFSINIYGF